MRKMTFAPCLRRCALGFALTLGCASARAQAPMQAAPATPTAEDKRKALEADTERLVQLARELKAELERTRQDELSVKVLRDADEIDKLARSARSRIR